MSTRVERVAIVGGGASAWLSAAALKRAFRHRALQVTVVDCGCPPDAPLARWTLPSLRGIHGLLGIKEPEFVRHTEATFKLAAEHRGWQGEASRFMHAHGEIGSDLGGTPFYKYLLQQALAGRAESAEVYSLAAVAARSGRFAQPMPQSALTSSFTYAFHLDEAAYTAYLHTHAEKLGVTRAEGALADLVFAEGGHVTALTLEGGGRIEADYFLDCSGSQAVLMNRVLTVDRKDRAAREDWTGWLPNDRMLCARAPALDDPRPITETTAGHTGWFWRIPLAQSSVVGHVWNSAFSSEDEALQSLKNAMPGCSEDPVICRMSSGRRKVFWDRNCVALGDAAMQLEPLAGAGLYFAELGIATFIGLFPLDAQSPLEAIEYNRILGEHADALRDFTIAHYRAGREREGEYWRAIRAQPMPDRLADKLDLYRANGRISLLDNETFEEVDWAWLLLGAGCLPDSIELHARVNLERARAQEFVTLRESIEGLAASMPRHIDYVRHQR